MKKTLSLIIGLFFLTNGIFAQEFLTAKKSTQRPTKQMYQTSFTEKSLTSGEIQCKTRYIAESIMSLEFVFTYSSSDLEYIDGVSMTFPEGMKPLSEGTSNPLTASNGCVETNLQLQDITGQTVVWGEIEEQSNCGAIAPGTYNFTVAVEIGEITDNQEVEYSIFGDGYGEDPHTLNGNCTILQAYENDIALLNSNIIVFYDLGVTVSPEVTIKNNGSKTQVFHINLTITEDETEVYNTTSDDIELLANTEMQYTFEKDWITENGSFLAKFAITEDDEDNSNNTLEYSINVMEIKNAYAWNAYDPTNTIPDGPVNVLIPGGLLSSIASDDSDFIAGADFINDDWYGITSTGKVYIINKENGNKTIIGSTGLESCTGLTYDVTSSTMFVSAYGGSNSTLYEANMYTGAVTLIGNITDAIVIGIACNNSGELYGITLSDELVKINKETGAGTVVGPLGVDLNYAQDIAFDRDFDILYGTLYSSSIGGFFATIDVLTGEVEIISNFGCEITGFAIPYTYEVPENDIYVTSISTFKSGCGLSEKQEVTIGIKNFGKNDQENITVSYTVNDNDPIFEVINVTIASGETYEYTFSELIDPTIVGKYTVVACTHLENDDNITNDCKIKSFMHYPNESIPYSMDFESTDDFSNWRVFDDNNDNVSWTIDSGSSFAHSGSQFAIYLYNTDEVTPANDWIISTCIELKAEESYSLSFWHRVGEFGSTAFPEKLKVAIGTEQTPEAMTKVIKNLGVISNLDYTLSKTEFQVANDGIYYIGWHVYSNPNMYYLLLDDIKIEPTTSINENETQNITVYPNPAKDLVKVVSDDVINTIEIVNTLGQVVYSSDVNAFGYIMDVAHLQNGLYIVQIITEKGIANKQIIISK